MNNIKQIITEIAREIGIYTIGFTSKLDFGYLKQSLIERTNNNYNNEFEEQDLNKRLDVKSVFPKCKSIIVIGVPYAMGYKKINPLDKGLISVVSYGEDYHMKVRKLLINFVQKIQDKIDFEYDICIDTSPLIDREICKNAGIGMYGKNSLLINDNLGSFMNLGYILTDLDIEGENNIENTDICKNCNICLKSCPNNAIFENGVVNTKKCVSYLTQTKMYIPIEYRKNMSNQIYGCDACQLVCPKNKKVAEMESDNDYRDLIVDLDELLNISNTDFNKKYGLMSGSWRGKNIWKRNAIISIANLDMKYMFNKVKDELENPSGMIKTYAAWSIMMLDKQKASDILYSNIKYEKDIICKEYKKLLEEELLC